MNVRSAEEAQRIFLRKEKGNFTVLDYYKTDHLLPTTVNDNKGSIEVGVFTILSISVLYFV